MTQRILANQNRQVMKAGAECDPGFFTRSVAAEAANFCNPAEYRIAQFT